MACQRGRYDFAAARAGGTPGFGYHGHKESVGVGERGTCQSGGRSWRLVASKNGDAKEIADSDVYEIITASRAPF
jgi:hypothetical protein